MRRRSIQVVALAAVTAPALAFTFGGWAIVTVEDMPEYAVAGQQITIPYVVRQHGVTLLSQLNGTVTATAPGVDKPVTVHTQNMTGTRYDAKLTLPKPGLWTITIASGFLNSGTTLRPLMVVAANVAPPKPLIAVARGEELFIAKGCGTCHMRGEHQPSLNFNAPVLTGRMYNADMLAAFLTDPEKSPLARTQNLQPRMPNLSLKSQEIAALVAYINSDSRVAAKIEQ